MQLIPSPQPLQSTVGLPEGEGQGVRADYTLADSWIWAKLQTLIRDVERQFQNFQYGQAGQQIYEFIWSDFADWYVEIAKGQMQNEATKQQTVETLARVFDISLRLLHPFTPFITEEVWGHLRNALLESPISDVAKDWPEVLIVAKFPEPRELEGWEESKIADFTLIQELVRSIRNLRAEKNVAPSKKLPAQFAAGDKTELLKGQSAVIASLAGLDFSLLTIHQFPNRETRRRRCSCGRLGRDLHSARRHGGPGKRQAAPRKRIEGSAVSH